MTLTEEAVLGCLALGVMLLFFVPGIGILFILLACVFAWGSVRQVPAYPPTIAIPTVWGVRQPTIIHERLTLASSHIPFVEDLIVIGITRQSRTLDIKSIRCRAVMASSKKKKGRLVGSSVDARVGMVFQPDTQSAESVIDYLNAGGQGWPPFHHHDGDITVDKEAEERNERDAVWKQLEMLVTGALRQEASTRTWIEVANSKAELSATLITRLTGQKPELRVVRNEHGIPVPDLDPHSEYEFLTEPIPDGYVLQAEDYQIFLQDININGARDVRGLGIVIRSVTVEEVDPEEAVKLDAAQADREAAQREAEIIDFDTEMMLAKNYIKAAKKLGQEMTLEDALKKVRVNRKRAEEIDINTNSDPFVTGAAIFGRGKKGGGGGKGGTGNDNGPTKPSP